MENRNLEKALDIVSKLITGEELTERVTIVLYIRNITTMQKSMT